MAIAPEWGFVMGSVENMDASGTSDIASAGAGLDTFSGSSNLTFVGGSGDDTSIFTSDQGSATFALGQTDLLQDFEHWWQQSDSTLRAFFVAIRQSERWAKLLK